MSFQLEAQTRKVTSIDSTRYAYHQTVIAGNAYSAFLNSGGFQLLNSKSQTIAARVERYSDLKFSDFNHDGFKDVFLDKGGNTPERYDILLYVPSIKGFKEVVNFSLFPDPKPIKGSRYYYSYHRNGCADSDWVSDLFYINDFKAERIGMVEGVGCGTEEVKTAIYVYKVKGGMKTLIKVFPINTVEKYEKNKWGFIQQYWTRQYKQFL
jgi:hypothetical protein